MTDRFASVAPVFKVDGAVKGELARDLIRLEIEEDTGGLRRLTARFKLSIARLQSPRRYRSSPSRKQSSTPTAVTARARSVSRRAFASSPNCSSKRARR